MDSRTLRIHGRKSCTSSSDARPEGKPTRRVLRFVLFSSVKLLLYSKGLGGSPALDTNETV